MTFLGHFPEPDLLRRAIEGAYRADETACVEMLLDEAALPRDARARVAETARTLVEVIRSRGARAGGIDAFMNEYKLTNQEGVILMCLAEALLRIPDPETASRLIRDKIADADWETHLGRSESLFVNASTWALMLTGRVVKVEADALRDIRSFVHRLVAKSGEPVIRQAMIQAMRILGKQFVMGRTIDEALARAREPEGRGYRYTYDMLGEAALTGRDAENYFEAYSAAIVAVGKASAGRGVVEGPGISVKLSALHPRFEFSHCSRLIEELVPRVASLVALARDADIGFCIDTEEADRLDITLDVIDNVFADPRLAEWEGFGLAIQAYQ